MTEQRRLAAILVADVVGYSKLIGSDETGTLAQLQALRTEIIDGQIAKHAGRLFKSVGDGFLIEFSSAVQAVSCAKEIQEANAQGALPLRIGIHVGDVVVQGDDLMGDGVNVAARIESVADAGGIAMSRQARDQVRDKLSVELIDKGEVELKNIARPVRIFLVAGGTFRQATAAAPVLALPDKPSIAVLPFQNMSRDPEQEYFAHGISEDIITELTRFRELFVIARNSSFSYKGKSPNVREVGRELGVRYVLEGSVRRAGSRIRLTGQLVDAQTGAHIWAERYDRQLDDVFLVQEELTRSIVRAIAPQISDTELSRVRRRNPASLSAYELAVRANATAFDAWTHPEVRQEALRLAEAALAVDPASTLALEARATARHQQALLGTAVDREAAWRDGIAATEQMLELDRSSSRAHAWKGLLLAYAPAEDRLEDALASARQGHELNPNDLITLVSLAYVENMAGNPERAIELTQEALRISPRDPLRPYLNHNLAMANFAVGRYPEAIEHARRAIAEAPQLSPPHAWLAASYVGLGQYDQARSALTAARRAGPKYIELLLSGKITAHNPDYRARVTTFLRIAAGLENTKVATPALALPDKPSIAVLPFQNMSGDPEQEYFADGMVEEIITALSRFRSFVVIARNSSFTYKGRAVDIKRVGRELGVRYVLEGSVRKGGDRVRITGQLIDTESGAHLWADKFDGSLASVFDLQEQVTTKVVSAIAPKLQQNNIERARRKPTEKMDSYDCFLRGMAAMADRSKMPTSEAEDWFRRATELDPEHAAALACLAHTIQIKAIMKDVPLIPAERTEAIELSERACKLAPDDGSVLGRAAQIICYTGRQYDRANSLMEDAVKLNPNDAGTWNHRGWVALMCHEPERAVQSFEHSLVLDPLNPRRGTIWNGMAFGYFILGQHEKGQEFAEKSVELNADVHSLPALIANEVRSGRLADARRRTTQLMTINPGFRASHSHHLFPVRSPEFHRLLADALREVGISE
jgi:adenylate cyclase